MTENSIVLFPPMRRLLEAGQPGLHPLFVKQAITMSMDRKDRERELVSSLLSELHPTVITDDQVGRESAKQG